MPMGKETQEWLAVKLPKLAPVADALERAMEAIDLQNGGFGTITLHRKKQRISDFDVLWRQYLDDDTKRIS